MTETPIVELTDVAKTYANGAVALDGFCMTLRDGEFVSLLGPSGCGKSTVLRLIARLSQPTRGVVRRAWDDSSASGSNDDEQPLGCVFQEPTLLPWATVWRNVYLPLRLQGVAKAAAKSQVNDALKMVGLSEFAGAYPRELSGGMKMRVSIARALVTQPALLLMDEPFAALDEINRFKLNDDLLALWRTLGKTIVFVTHSVFESVYLSSRIVVMTPRPGRVFSELAVDAPRPREARFRTSAEYAALCRKTSDALANAIGEAA